MYSYSENSNNSNNHKRGGRKWRKLISRKGRQRQQQADGCGDVRVPVQRCLDPIPGASAAPASAPPPANSRLRYSTLIIQLLTLNLALLVFVSLKPIILETEAAPSPATRTTTKDYEDHIQRFSLHSREDCTDGGEFYTSNIKNLMPISELAQTGTMKCFCVWHGMWIFTTMRNYERAFMPENTGMNQMFNPGKICESRKINWHYIQLSSIRHVGNVNDSLPGLSLYRDTDYYGRELYLAAPPGPSGSVSLALPAPKHIKSYGLTGRKRWTIYENTNFTGNSSCLTPVVHGSDMDIKVEPKVSFTVGSIQSGCLSSVASTSATAGMGSGRRKFYDQDNLIALYKAEPWVRNSGSGFGNGNVNGNGNVTSPPSSPRPRVRNSGQGSRGHGRDLDREAKLVFDGEELRLTSSVRFRHYSVIGAETWTIYSGTEYNGKCECLFPMGSLDQIERMRQFSGLRLRPDPSASASAATTAIYYETMPLPMKNNGTRLVGSIRRGCFVCKMPYTDPALPFSDEYTDYSPEDLEEYEEELLDEILQVADEQLLQNGSFSLSNGRLNGNGNGTYDPGFNSSRELDSGENLEEIRSEPVPNAAAAAAVFASTKDIIEIGFVVLMLKLVAISLIHT